MAGTSIILSVFITGFNLPLSSISWAWQGTTLTGSEQRVTITNTTTTTTTVISALMVSALIPGDSGRYTVTATNDAGNDTLEATLSVTGEGGVRGELGCDLYSNVVLVSMLRCCENH